jgi:transketolase
MTIAAMSQRDPRAMVPPDHKPVASRQAFGEALKELGDTDPRIVVLDADLSKSTMSMVFQKAHPDRFFEMGIQEANMLGTASGLALSGRVPFCCSFACFITGRFDQIKMSVAYSNAKVRIVGTHAGVGIGPDGYSQQGLEDIALLRSLPGMLVLQPADESETKQMVRALADDPRPAYLRLTRQDLPAVHSSDYRWEAGVWPTLVDGDDVCIFATGGTVGFAVEAALALHKKGTKARVVNASTLKPVDAAAIERAARECGRLVTVEDHTVMGGLGSAVAEVVVETTPVPLRRLGVRDVFGESGEPADLYKHHRLDAPGIEADVAAFLKERAA